MHPFVQFPGAGGVLMGPGWQQQAPAIPVQSMSLMHPAMVTPELVVLLDELPVLLDELVVKPPVPPELDDEPPGMHMPAWHVPTAQAAPSGFGT